MSNWSLKESKFFVSSRLPNSPAVGYTKPDFKKIAVNILSDDEDFVPSYEDCQYAATLIANIPNKKLVLSKNSQAVIDCGFSLEIPSGYKICASSCLSNIYLNLIDSNRIKANILNLGEELILHHKQKIGKIWIEPIYFFEWITKG